MSEQHVIVDALGYGVFIQVLCIAIPFYVLLWKIGGTLRRERKQP